jgi:nucleoside-diphosphate-sugar epimerase
LPVAEDAPLRPISPYGFHKLTCEVLAAEYASCFDLNILVARLFSVFGPAQRRLLVWELYDQLAGPDDTAWLQGTGDETRDFIHVDDAVDALLFAAAHLSKTRPAGRPTTLNIASGDEISTLALATSIRDRVAPHKKVACRGIERPGDPRRWRADIGALLELVKPWRPRLPADTLPECIAAWERDRHRREHQSVL